MAKRKFFPVVCGTDFLGEPETERTVGLRLISEPWCCWLLVQLAIGVAVGAVGATVGAAVGAAVDGFLCCWCSWLLVLLLVLLLGGGAVGVCLFVC